MSIYHRMFTAREVIAAADISMSTLQNWLKRNVIVGHKTIEGGGERGKHRRFSWYNVMEICAAAALVRAGVSDLGLAFAAGMKFGHNNPQARTRAPQRAIAMPYETSHGGTLLIAAGNRSNVVCHKIGADPITAVRAELGQPEAFIIIDLLQMFGRACAALNLNPQAILIEAYAEERDD